MIAYYDELDVGQSKAQHYISVSQLTGFFVNLFLLPKGVVCGEAGAK